MAETETNVSPGLATGEAELKFRYYQARLGVWKVVLGTMIVGLAGVAIPNAINYYNARFENARKETELILSQQSAHQQYIKDFFTTAINQDIELRIRFAGYFARLSGPGQEQLWNSYLADLKTQRDETRREINDLEGQLVEFEKLLLEKKEIDNAVYDRINREKTWAYAEIGYVPIERSAIVRQNDGSAFAEKQRLYTETTDIVRRLADLQGPIDESSSDFLRFWVLYNKDLIGVESPEFARTMIAIGAHLKKLAAEDAPPDAELKRLAEILQIFSQMEQLEEAGAFRALIQQSQ